MKGAKKFILTREGYRGVTILVQAVQRSYARTLLSINFVYKWCGESSHVSLLIGFQMYGRKGCGSSEPDGSRHGFGGSRVSPLCGGLLKNPPLVFLFTVVFDCRQL